MLKIGTPVIYKMNKYGTSPGPRAQDVRPATRGDTYSYKVDKFWVVVEVRDDKVVLQTRRGKKHEVDPNDPSLRPANWLERIWHRQRFPDFRSSESTN